MKAAEIIALVHERDALVEERARLVSDLDRKIAVIDAQLDGLGQKSSSANRHTLTSNGQVVDSLPMPRLFVRVPADAETRKTDQVLAMIEANPQLDYGEVCAAVYKEDTEATRKRLRSLLSSMVTANKIRNVGRNTWEVVREDA